MHFTKMQFSFNGNPILEPKENKAINLGSSNGPTILDYLHIILLYCEGKENEIDYNDIHMLDSIVHLLSTIVLNTKI